ncbi:MAG: hypothetical protein IT373_36550 [Polyangiaceae bacterium]|nr:hypothetical protein [Polyangiaceae bacterium]
MLALLGLAGAGCRPDTCASPCPPVITVGELCKASNACTIGGGIVSNLWNATLGPSQALVVELGYLDITETPDLVLFTFLCQTPPPAGETGPLPDTFLVTMNGVVGEHVAQSPRRSLYDIDVRWPVLPAAPRTLVIARTDSTNCDLTALAATFVDADCENAHPASCE